MTSLKLALAALLVGSSLAPAFADNDQEGRLVPVEQATRVVAPVQEGRQAAPIAKPQSITDGERYVIDRNDAYN